MEKQIDIICFSISRADAAISSPGYSLAKEFSKTHRVFYIEHPHSFKDLFVEWNTVGVKRRRKTWFGDASPYKSDKSGVTIVTPPLVLPINALPEGTVYSRAAAMNDRKIFNLIRRIRKDFAISEYLFINFFDPFYCRDFPSDIRPRKIVYQCMDAISEVPYTAKHGVRLENELVSKADLTICTSSGLVEHHRSRSGHVALLANGVDPELFSKSGTGIPAEIASGNKPLVGYVGSIEYRMDFDLLVSVAKSLPSYEFYFIGPIVGNSPGLKLMKACSNVRFLGPKLQEQIPGYLSHFDAMLIPFKCNHLTSMVYPLKLNEYLLAGKPVIATNFSRDLSSFEPHVYIAHNAEEFARLISISVQEDSSSRISARIDCARQNSWSARATRFFELLHQES